MLNYTSKLAWRMLLIFELEGVPSFENNAKAHRSPLDMRRLRFWHRRRLRAEGLRPSIARALSVAARARLHRVYIAVATTDPCVRRRCDEMQIYLGGLSGAGSGGRDGGGSIGLPGLGSRIGSGIGSGGLSIGGDGSGDRPALLTPLFDNTDIARMDPKRVNSAEVPAHLLVMYEIRRR